MWNVYTIKLWDGKRNIWMNKRKSPWMWKQAQSRELIAYLRTHKKDLHIYHLFLLPFFNPPIIGDGTTPIINPKPQP